MTTLQPELGSVDLDINRMASVLSGGTTQSYKELIEGQLWAVNKIEYDRFSNQAISEINQNPPIPNIAGVIAKHGDTIQPTPISICILEEVAYDPWLAIRLHKYAMEQVKAGVPYLNYAAWLTDRSLDAGRTLSPAVVAATYDAMGIGDRNTTPDNNTRSLADNMLTYGRSY